MKQEAAFAKRQDDALTMLPSKDRMPLVPYHRPDLDVNKMSETVQSSFSRFPQLCSKVDSDGPDKCLHCLFRLKRLDVMRALRQRNLKESGHGGANAEEMDLLEFHDSGAKCSRMVVEEMPAVYDMPKVRGLFDLAGEPPRRERAHKDKTVMRLAGAPSPLDRVRFLQEVSCVFVDFQVKHLTSKLMALVNSAIESSGTHHSKARCSTHQFESAVCNAGMLNKVTKRKISRAFHRLGALDRHQHDNRQKHRHMRRASTMGSELSVNAMKKITGTTTTSASDMRLNFTQHLDEDPEHDEEAFETVASFHFMTWLRASEHAAVQIDCEISIGEDVEWALVLYDFLDHEWPWQPQEEGAAETGVDDEQGAIFRGLLLGITSRPVIIGPEYVTTSVSGLRLHNPAVLHRGQMLPGLAPSIVKANRRDPVVVRLRLDRRRLAEERKGYACRLWMQRLSGCTELDDAAQVIIDDMGIDNDVDLFPCVYASRPESDIRHAVKLRACDIACSAGIKAGDPTVGQECSYLHTELKAVPRAVRKSLLAIQHGHACVHELSPEHKKIADSLSPSKQPGMSPRQNSGMLGREDSVLQA